MRGVLVSLATVALLFGLLEAGLRFYFGHFASQEHVGRWVRLVDMPPEALRYRPHPYLCYCLNPDFRSDDGLDRHNSLGFRGDEFPRAKPPGAFRIACLGGSTTYDTDIPDFRNAYPAQLETVLRETYGRREVQVINAGVPGYTTWDSLLNFEFRVLELDPDLVIVYHSTNDVHARLVPPETYRRDNTGYRQAWTDRARWWEGSLVLRILGLGLGLGQRNKLGDWVLVPEARREDRHIGAREMERLAANPPVFFRENLEDLIALARHRGVQVVLATWAYCPAKGDYASTEPYREGYREQNEILSDLARETAALLYDFASEMPTDPEYWSDGRHNNEKGARKKAELFAAYLESHLFSER